MINIVVEFITKFVSTILSRFFTTFGLNKDFGLQIMISFCSFMQKHGNKSYKFETIEILNLIKCIDKCKISTTICRHGDYLFLSKSDDGLLVTFNLDSAEGSEKIVISIYLLSDIEMKIEEILKLHKNQTIKLGADK